MRTREGVREDVQRPRNELGQESNGMRLRPTQDLLSQRVQKRRPGAPLLAQIGHRSAVVAKNRDSQPLERGQKMVEALPDSQELARVDGQRSLLLVPKA